MSLVVRAPLLRTSDSFSFSAYPRLSFGRLASQASNPFDPFHRCRNEGTYGTSVGKEEFTPVFWGSPFLGLSFSRAAGRAPNFVGGWLRL
ncbi:hypothetical protein Pyn_10137 [Prunus yedoensis var. nudiflora]|uniref:Uncharacterized protein n=1 Tax=Prunus yedoensis var. nudiflora TaxID=2094558 RepID=A0A314YMM8_PRUYE|nr:hypothetical protein Pyn_10137 [Prunus yedoensis var. nudiflora]